MHSKRRIWIQCSTYRRTSFPPTSKPRYRRGSLPTAFAETKLAIGYIHVPVVFPTTRTRHVRKGRKLLRLRENVIPPRKEFEHSRYHTMRRSLRNSSSTSHIPELEGLMQAVPRILPQFRLGYAFSRRTMRRGDVRGTCIRMLGSSSWVGGNLMEWFVWVGFGLVRREN